MKIGPRDFSEVWLVDFEFEATPGECPVPICMVARDLASGKTLRVWQDELNMLKAPPYSVGDDSLFVAYYASAEVGCHLALGWPVPRHVLDLYAEFRNLTNGKETSCGRGLLGALTYYGLSALDGDEKNEMRQLALRGGPWNDDERIALLAYCESDVDALARLLPKMQPGIDLPRALLRGRYMVAAARIENAGVPIDPEGLRALRARWEIIKERLTHEIDRDYGVFDGLTFKAELWAKWLSANDIPWPRLPSGELALDDNTFREMARIHPRVGPIRELRASLSQMRLADLAVGRDGRNRCLLSAFQSKTGRNQPSNAKFIFGPAVWLRSLIKPQPDFAVAYLDWSQQEFGIAAALSRDPVMIAAYESGDPYLAFAKQAGAVPPDGTKATHGKIRDQYKNCALAVQYGMGASSLAIRIRQPIVVARNLLGIHRRTYSRFWEWSDSTLDRVMLPGDQRLWTVFGWTLHATTAPNPRSIRNFPMQANGAEMLRLACCLTTESGITVCAPVHDALLIEAPASKIDDAVRLAQAAMADASAIVLGGFRLRSDAKVVRHPERYQDERGRHMWEKVMGVLDQLDHPKTGALLHTPPVQGSAATCAPEQTRSISLPLSSLSS